MDMSIGERSRTHGMSDTPEYGVWSRMIDRCENPNIHNYDRYGGRGIKLCEAWRADFTAFYRDMGPRPSPRHSIERDDVDLDYAPSNCCWATAREQANNRSNNRMVTYHGEEMTLAEAVRSAGEVVEFHTARKRLNRGWEVARAVETPALFTVPWTKCK